MMATPMSLLLSPLLRSVSGASNDDDDDDETSSRRRCLFRISARSSGGIVSVPAAVAGSSPSGIVAATATAAPSIVAAVLVAADTGFVVDNATTVRTSAAKNKTRRIVAMVDTIDLGIFAIVMLFGASVMLVCPFDRKIVVRDSRALQ